MIRIIFFTLLILKAAYMYTENLKFISPLNEKINFSGRVDLSDNETAKYSWSGVNFSFIFYGKNLILEFNDGYNDYEIFMDGKYFKTIETTTFKKKYEIFSSNKEEKHHFKVVKRTEAIYGIGVFKGMWVDIDAELLENEKNYKIKFEFIGDSITCGYGIEANLPDIPNSRKYENFTKTYAYLISETFSAEYHVVAISGKGLVRNYGENKRESLDPLPFYYKRTLQGIDFDDWNFNNFQADIVFIALGENDFSTSPEAESKKYYEEYKKFISLIRKNYPSSKIIMICTVSNREIYRKTLQETYKKISQEFKNIYYFEFPFTKNEELGCDSHPNYLAHQRFAYALKNFLISSNLTKDPTKN